MSRFVARIAYTNTEPFFFHWPLHQFPLVSGVPRQLAIDAAIHDDILGGPLPIVETWNLSERYEPFNSWGIAAMENCMSVLLLSNVPISEMNGVTVGVTTESSTSVALLDVLIKARYGHDVTIRRGLNHNDDAWLVIGDQALKIFAGSRLDDWSYLTDLATEWWNWQRLPFVFARWVIRKGTDPDQRIEFEEAVKVSLFKGLASIPSIALYQAALMKIPVQAIETYLKGFIYELGPSEEKSAQLFHSMVDQLKKKSPQLIVR